MDASDLLLDHWTQQVKQVWSTFHVYQQETVALAIFGIVLTGQAVMHRVADCLHERLEEAVKTSSYERQFQRFVANEKIEVQAWWDQFLPHVLPFWKQRSVTLVLDCSPYNQQFTLVYVGILCNKRILPLAWELMPQSETWEQGLWEIVDRLAAQVDQSLSAKEVTLLADRGLAALPLIRLCQRYAWHYLLRIKNDVSCRRKWRTWYKDWQQGKAFVLKAGMSWYGEVLLWQEHSFACQLAACWEVGCEEGWFLISDRRATHRLVSIYAMRMRVEATFQDTKSRRWCIESSQFRIRDHLNRWLLVVFVAFWWTTHLGASAKHQGEAKAFDRTDRFDKSLLRLGHLWIKEVLKRANAGLRRQSNVEAARLANCLLFHRTKDGLRFSICTST